VAASYPPPAQSPGSEVPQQPDHPTIDREPFGTTTSGEPVDRYVLRDPSGTSAAILTYGGIIASFTVPDRDGAHRNVLLGLSDVAAYERRSPYFGAIIGRYANRIAGSTFDLGGTTYRVPANEPPHSLHGGDAGFDKRVWDATATAGAGGAVLRLTRTSPDGEEGFPGTLQVTVTYTLRRGDLRIDYHATTDADTVVNFTNHAYFNLAGEGAGSVADQELTIHASHYTPIDAALIPTGEIAPVAGTPFDFTVPTAIGARIREGHEQLCRAQGYDHNWVLDAGAQSDGLVLAAEAYDPGSGRTLSVLTDQPGVQFYSGNQLDGTIVGPSGRTYRQGDAFTLETQHFPDSPHHPHFPSTVLRSGEELASSTIYRFSTR